MAQKSLEEIREMLVGAFEKAVEQGKRYSTSVGVGPENLKAAAELAKAIARIDDQLDRRNEQKNGMKMPGKG